jgi:hypothetical protein
VIPQPSPAALFVVRAWFEEGSFRARVSRSEDLHLGRAEEVLITDAQELHLLLAGWLHTLDPDH